MKIEGDIDRAGSPIVDSLVEILRIASGEATPTRSVPQEWLRPDDDLHYQ